MTGKKILVVDYDAVSVKALSDLFSSRGLEVITAKDGQKAYEAFKEENPDLVLLEAMIPKIHGFDLTATIHKESSGSVPVVIVTGLYKDPQHRNEALNTFGASDYFEKPYDEEKLVDSVMNLLQEDLDIGEDLPTPEEVAQILKKRLEKPD